MQDKCIANVLLHLFVQTVTCCLAPVATINTESNIYDDTVVHSAHRLHGFSKISVTIRDLP